MTKGKKILLIVGGIFGLLIILAIATPSGRKGLKEGASINTEKKQEATPSPTPEAKKEMKGSAAFNGTQFAVTNKNDFDWLECKFEANSGLIKGGYTYNAPLAIKAGETYSVGARQFAKGDGTRFDPINIKAQNFSANCKDDKGEMLFGYWEWN